MFTKIRTHFLAKGRSRQSGGNPDRSTSNNGSKRELSSVGRGLFIRTFQFVLFAQVLLFVMLLSIFERFQLQNAVASADLAGQFAVKILYISTDDQEETGVKSTTADQGETGGKKETDDQQRIDGQEETGEQGEADCQEETGETQRADANKEEGSSSGISEKLKEEITNMVEETRLLLWDRYGVEPSRYRVDPPDDRIVFARFVNSSVEPTTRSDTIELENLELYDYFLNASRRLLWPGEGGIVQLTNIRAMPPESVEECDISVAIETVTLNGSKLRSDTVDFVGTFLIQAAVVLLVVPLLMYFIGSRLVTGQIENFIKRTAHFVKDPIGRSETKSSNGSSLREFHEANANMDILRGEFRKLLEDRSGVEHDIKDELVTHSEIAKVLIEGVKKSGKYLKDQAAQFKDMQHANPKEFNATAKETASTVDSDVRELQELGDLLIELQDDTLVFMYDFFQFVSMEDPCDGAKIIELRKFCWTLLDNNGYIRFADYEPRGDVTEKFIVLKAVLSVPEELRVYLNKALLRSIISNLVRNSVSELRKGEPGRTWQNKFLEIHARQEDGVVSVSVRDNGRGLKETSNRSRSSGSKSKKSKIRSWGVGLQMTKHRIHTMGGTMRIAKNPIPPKGSDTAGAEVIFTLPATAEAAKRMSKA